MDSEVTKGTKFRLTLPSYVDKEQILQETDNQPVESREALVEGRERIVLLLRDENDKKILRTHNVSHLTVLNNFNELQAFVVKTFVIMDADFILREHFS